LTLTDAPVLRDGEARNGYRTLLWPIGRGSAVALYPNLTTTDPVWRTLLRDVRFRRALSLAIDRKTLDNSLWFGLGTPSNNTVMPESGFFRETLRDAWTSYDPAQANALLDEIGLQQAEIAGFRALPDGRRLEIVVEVAGNAGEQIDALQIIAEFWAEVGVKLIIKPQDMANMRERAYAGKTVMVAGPGLDNAVPTEIMPPTELAPVRQDSMVWPRWGQHFETSGRSGEKPDMPEAVALLELYQRWLSTGDAEVKRQVWSQMLQMHADEQFIIGTVAGTLQPIIIAQGLRNVPEQALFAWEPTAFFGAYRMDQFFFDDQRTTAVAQ
jgi:peptide/nickel transport system substrate-binding protein